MLKNIYFANFYFSLLSPLDAPPKQVIGSNNAKFVFSIFPSLNILATSVFEKDSGDRFK